MLYKTMEIWQVAQKVSCSASRRSELANYTANIHERKRRASMYWQCSLRNTSGISDVATLDPSTLFPIQLEFGGDNASGNLRSRLLNPLLYRSYLVRQKALQLRLANPQRPGSPH